MNFNLSDEQQMLRDGAERFVRECCTLEHRRRVAGSTGFDKDNWARMAELGWLMLPFSEAEGGLGGTPADVALLMTAFGRGLVLEPFVTTALLCGPILAQAKDRQLAALTQSIMAGELRVALAHDEGQCAAPSETLPQTLAQVDGSGYRISGKKRSVLDAPHAHRIIVSASLEGEVALLLLDSEASSLERRNYPLIDGTRAADIDLLSVAASGDALIARGAEASRLLQLGLDQAKLAALAQSVGSIEEVLDMCSDYLKTREQFGRPIGQFQALQHIMAQMFVEAQEARSILYWAVAAMRLPPKERAAGIAQAKVVIGHAAQFVSRQGVQLHGGYGMTEEFAIGHHFKRLLTLEKMFGDADSHLARLAKLAVGSREECA